MMKDDPAIEAIRSARKAISREFGNDPARLVEHYIEYQKRFAARLRPSPPSVSEQHETDAAEQRDEPDRSRGA